jgi:hypothetical protein
MHAEKDAVAAAARAPKERPILFSGAMVRALLDGSKTQTRRIAKPRRKPSLLDGTWTDDYVLDAGNHEWLMADNPYGQPGDRLWVRETFVHIDDEGDKFDGMGSQTYYRASCPQPERDDAWLRERGLRWRPSIHMPRARSRILLEVVSVRVERLQDISEADAQSEGVAEWARGACAAGNPNGYTDVGYYSLLWEQINGAGSWDANPWVWVVEFKRVQP